MCTTTARHSTVASADGTSLALRTHGRGKPLLLVHGGMSHATAWDPLVPLLAPHLAVTTLDRRGHGASSDTAPYSPEREYEDLCAVAEHLAATAPGTPTVDVLAHSYGALCALGAAARGAPVAKLILHEPPGPAAIPPHWPRQARAWLDAGHTHRAVGSFLTDVIGLDQTAVTGARDEQRAAEAVALAQTTLLRELHAILAIDLDTLARAVPCPTWLVRGQHGPAWAVQIQHQLHAAIPDSTITVVPGIAHDPVAEHPDRIAILTLDITASTTRPT